MKKKSVPVGETTFTCISCSVKYVTRTVFEHKKVERITSCANCNPFYSGASASSMRVGAVEKFRERGEKFNKKKK